MSRRRSLEQGLRVFAHKVTKARVEDEGGRTRAARRGGQHDGLTARVVKRARARTRAAVRCSGAGYWREFGAGYLRDLA